MARTTCQASPTHGRPLVASQQTYDKGVFKENSTICLLIWTTSCKHKRLESPFPRLPRPPEKCTGHGRHLPVSRRFPGDPSSTSESPQVLRDLFLGCRRVSNLGRNFSICRREQKCVCLHRLMAPPLRRPPPAHRHYWRGWALEGVRLPGRSECKCYVIHYQM